MSVKLPARTVVADPLCECARRAFHNSSLLAEFSADLSTHSVLS